MNALELIMNYMKLFLQGPMYYFHSGSGMNKILN